jgi:hypothetical protein
MPFMGMLNNYAPLRRYIATKCRVTTVWRKYGTDVHVSLDAGNERHGVPCPFLNFEAKFKTSILVRITFTQLRLLAHGPNCREAIPSW